MPNRFTNILVAPAPFKGLLTAAQVADAIKEGVLLAHPEANVKVLPMADGGTGLVSAIHSALGGELHKLDVVGPYGQTVTAKYAIINNRDVAVIEMASAAGFIYAPKSERNPMQATTKGVGQLILDAVDQGCTQIILGLGDSATVDLGVGMAAALGYKFLDKKGTQVTPIPENFELIDQIDLSGVSTKLKDVNFFGYADVLNPVLGSNGAVKVYGPQKGVTSEMFPKLEASIEHLVKIMEEAFKVKLSDEPMTGAAGGLGAGVRSFLNGSLVHGAPAIARLIGLGEHIKEADLVITGEGKLDEQSLSGKVISEVVLTATNLGKPCWIITGKVDTSDITKQLHVSKLIEASPEKIPSSPEEASELIKNAIMRTFGTGS